MTTQRIRYIYAVTFVLLDALLMVVAYLFAYLLRVNIPFPNDLQNVVPFSRYSYLVAAQVIAVLVIHFYRRQYYVRRAVSRVDQFYTIIIGVSLGTVVSIAVVAFLFKNEDNVVAFDYPRMMVIYAWILGIILIMLGRIAHQTVRIWLRRRGWDKDRLLIVGTGETARIILQRILWSPQLGYDVIGMVDEDSGARHVLNVPVIGLAEDLPRLIEENDIHEVIIAMPKKGHRAIVQTISYCERGRTSIKVVPDIFHSITSEATIDDLGGLPLLTVRDFAMRGYRLIFKRLIDVAGATFGLIFLAPVLLLVAVAIKLESPGAAFFVQERMGLDGQPFRMIKFRSMRVDAERGGPGWTVKNDPRRTRLGRLLRKIDIDEMPQLVNVLLGEMSLVGPRPEQPYYVNQFRLQVPRYMERHREKAGMTGWAQVNGLRGDTSIEERTRYDIWYTENWSVFLDVKIILRTVWQILLRRNGGDQPG